MFQTVLVPVDGSPLAERALLYARRLAHDSNGRIVLLQVVPASANADATIRTATLYLENLITQFSESSFDRPVVTAGDPASSILAEVEFHGIDLIVMSTHGRSGLGRWIYGSVADAVIRRAAVPVLLVPATGVAEWPDNRALRILVPLDGSELAETVLGAVANLSGTLNAEVLLLRAQEAPTAPEADRSTDSNGELPSERDRVDGYLDRVAAHLRAHGLRVRVETRPGHAATAIVEVTQEQSIDLVAMATHGSGGLTRLVMGSVAASVVQRATVPVLLVRPSANAAAESHPISVLGAHGIHESIDAAAKGDAEAARSLLVAMIGPDVGVELLIRQELQQTANPRFWEHLIEFLALGSWSGRFIETPPSTPLDRDYLRRRIENAFLPQAPTQADEAIRHALRASLRNPEPEIQAVALDLVGRRGDRAATDDVIAALSSDSMDVREEAARALGRLGGEASIEALTRALRAEHDVVSGFATQALTRIGVDAVPRLLEEFASPDAHVRWHVASALADIGDPRAIDALVRALDDSDPAVRWNAARGLARMGTAALVAVLHALLTRPLSPWFAQGARHVIRHSAIGDRSNRLQAVVLALGRPTASVEVPLRAEEALADLDAGSRKQFV